MSHFVSKQPIGSEISMKYLYCIDYNEQFCPPTSWAAGAGKGTGREQADFLWLLNKEFF